MAAAMNPEKKGFNACVAGAVPILPRGGIPWLAASSKKE
jgi:hypothetical protein